MTNLSDIAVLGVSRYWRTRKNLIQWIEKTTPSSIDPVVAYNARVDSKNVRNIPPSAYVPVGVRLFYKAEALALKKEPWEQKAIDALGYVAFGVQLDFFWHVQFRIIFPDHSQPLRMMSWELMVEAMAMFLLLGRTQEAIYQGYLTHSVLNRGYLFRQSFEARHRRVHAFMLRLFASWRGDVAHDWPPFAFSEPIYEGILERWREPDPEALKPWLWAACDRHTYETRMDSETVFHDCSRFARTPLEILFLFRLRALEGLPNPVLEHPLMEPPFDKLPDPQPAYVPDELVRGTLARVREDWPQFDQVVSLEAIR